MNTTERLLAAFNSIEATWAAFCQANGRLIHAKAARSSAAEEYLRARKHWEETIKVVTPGAVEGEVK